MLLENLGFSDWFREHLPDVVRENHNPARVVAVDKESYVVRSEIGETAADVTGRLMYKTESSLDFPTVGDWVLVQFYDEGTLAIIHQVLPRKTVLRRKVAGKKIEYQLIAANLDIAFIMQSLDANFNLRRLERYLVAVNESAIQPVILLSKSDLLAAGEIEQYVSRVREISSEYPVFPFSNRTGWGLEAIERMIQPGLTYCLLGSSGVGKTTLINRLLGRNTLAISDVREKDGKGRHTTTRRQLIVLANGGLLIDTPGMRELGTIGVETGLEITFQDIQTQAE